MLDSDQSSLDVLQCFIDDLGAQRALLFQDGEGSEEASLLMDTGAMAGSGPIDGRRRRGSDGSSPLFGWLPLAPRGTDDPDERILRLPLTIADQRLTLMIVFASATDCHQGFVEKAVRRLKPFLQICLGLWRKNHASLARGRTIEAAMHLSGLAVLVLDGHGALLFANHKAEDLLDRGDGLRRSGKSITSTSLPDALRLQVTIAHLAGQEPCLARAGASILTLARPHSPRPLIVAISSCGDGAGSADAARLTVLHVLDPEVATRPLIEPICDLYHLSRMERSLAIELVDGSSLTEAATRLKLKTQTARSYLKQIFIKTDTNRQTDLVRLLLNSAIRVSSPLLVALPSVAM